MAGFKWWQVYIAYGFLLTWNVIAMEAAACYIGECANPDQDAKIAMNLEGAYGVFIYTLIPIAFIVVLGAHALSDAVACRPEDHLRDVRRKGRSPALAVNSLTGSSPSC